MYRWGNYSWRVGKYLMPQGKRTAGMLSESSPAIVCKQCLKSMQTEPQKYANSGTIV